MEGYLFRFAPQKEKASQPSLSRYRYFIKKAEKALLQSAFSKNPVISFSVLRAMASVLNQPESWMGTLAFFVFLRLFVCMSRNCPALFCYADRAFETYSIIRVDTHRSL